MIRRPRTEDLSELKTFFKLVIEDTYIKEGLGDLVKEMADEVDSKMAYIKEDLANDGNDYHFLVMVVDDQIIGTAAYVPCSHLIYDHMPELKSVKELGSVFIHPKYQGKGYGSTLVNAVIDVIKEDYDSFCLDSGYTIAKKIWTKKFGQPTKVLKDFWGQGYDHYIWKIDL